MVCTCNKMCMYPCHLKYGIRVNMQCIIIVIEFKSMKQVIAVAWCFITLLYTSRTTSGCDNVPVYMYVHI